MALTLCEKQGVELPLVYMHPEMPEEAKREDGGSFAYLQERCHIIRCVLLSKIDVIVVDTTSADWYAFRCDTTHRKGFCLAGNRESRTPLGKSACVEDFFLGGTPFDKLRYFAVPTLDAHEDVLHPADDHKMFDVKWARGDLDALAEVLLTWNGSVRKATGHWYADYTRPEELTIPRPDVGISAPVPLPDDVEARLTYVHSKLGLFTLTERLCAEADPDFALAEYIVRTLRRLRDIRAALPERDWFALSDADVAIALRSTQFPMRVTPPLDPLNQ